MQEGDTQNACAFQHFNDDHEPKMASSTLLFSEMKGYVGMSHHEKEGGQEDAYTETGDH